MAMWIVIDFLKQVPTCNLDPIRYVSEVTGRFYQEVTQGSSETHKHLYALPGLVYLDTCMPGK
jgi:hypothetical protein